MAVLRESDYEWVLVAEEKGSQEERKMDSCQLKECLEKALHMRVCFYMGVSSSVEELGKSRRNLEQMEQEAVPGNNGMLFEEEWDKKDIAYVSPPWEIWEKEMSASDMIADTQEKILHFLEELWNSNQVTISTLEQFRRELMQMIYRYLNKQDVLITRILTEENLMSIMRVRWQPFQTWKFLSVIFLKSLLAFSIRITGRSRW